MTARLYTSPAALVQASLILLLIRKSRLMLNSRNGSTTAPQAGPSTMGISSGATAQRNVAADSESGILGFFWSAQAE